MRTEHLLQDALAARTAHLTPDPGSRAAIAARLDEPAPRGRVPGVPGVAAVPGVVAVVAVAASLALAAGGVALVAQAVDDGGADVIAAPPATLGGTDLFGAVRDDADVLVDARTGEVAVTLPRVAGQRFDEVVVSSRAGTAWGLTYATGTISAIDLASRSTTVLAQSPDIINLTVSADGSTLAWGRGSAALPSSVVVRPTGPGQTTVLAGLPVQAQVPPLALSPDGRTLALVSTSAGPDGTAGAQLLLVPVAGGFGQARAVAHAPCPGSADAVRTDQPSWTPQGLFALQRCVGPVVAVNDSSVTTAVVRIDTGAATTTSVVNLGPVATSGFAVTDGPLLVTGELTGELAFPERAAARVVVRDPAQPGADRPLADLSWLLDSGGL